MEIFSAGTSGTTARAFFERLRQADVSLVVDTRLNNVSQLAGFTKYPDLPYFVERLLGVEYVHELALAPEQDMLKAYRNKEISWQQYESRYVELLETRGVQDLIDRDVWGDRPLLLCSEHTADFCHRRLAADYLERRWGDSVVTGVSHI